MIEDNIIKDRVIAITSYCNTIEKTNVLIENLKLIRVKFPEYRIALHANYPLSGEIQKMVDMYFYEDLNHIDDNKWISYWHRMMNTSTNQFYFNKKFFYSILDSGYSVFQQIRTLTRYLIDYNWVMLINYDTAVEEIRINDYTTEYPLTVHHFPDQNAYSLIMMFYNPKIFWYKVVKQFTFENWHDIKRKDQLNEARLYDMVQDSGIKHFAHHYLVYDKISGEPDYHNRSNAPTNNFFKNYLLYHPENILEIYLWDLLTEINTITLKIDNDEYIILNENEMGGFECTLEYENSSIMNIEIKNINGIDVCIPLKIKDGYSTRLI